MLITFPSRLSVSSILFVSSFLHRDGRCSRITFVRRFRPIQFRRVALPGQIVIVRPVACDLIREIPSPLSEHSPSCWRARSPRLAWDPRRTLGHSRFFSLAGHGIGIRVTAAVNSNISLFPSADAHVFDVATTFPFSCRFPHRAVVHQLDTHSVKVWMARDFLVLAIGFDGNRGGASLAVDMPSCNR